MPTSNNHTADQKLNLKHFYNTRLYNEQQASIVGILSKWNQYTDLIAATRLSSAEEATEKKNAEKNKEALIDKHFQLLTTCQEYEHLHKAHDLMAQSLEKKTSLLNKEPKNISLAKAFAQTLSRTPAWILIPLVILCCSIGVPLILTGAIVPGVLFLCGPLLSSCLGFVLETYSLMKKTNKETQNNLEQSRKDLPIDRQKKDALATQLEEVLSEITRIGSSMLPSATSASQDALFAEAEKSATHSRSSTPPVA